MSAKNRRIVLHSAAGSASLRLFRLLIENGANLTQLADNRWSVLHEAAHRGNLNVLQFLLQEQALGLNAKDSNGETPRAIAAKSEANQAFRILLEQDIIQADTRDWRGHVVLQNLSASGDLSKMKLLLERGDIAVNTNEDHCCRTPLLHAAREGHVDMVLCLLEHGAEINVTDKFSWSPLNYAESNRRENIIQAFVDRGALRKTSRPRRDIAIGAS